MLRQSPSAQVAVNDPFGWPLNHTQPPFNNPKLRRALLPAIDQKTFLASVIGGQTDLGRAPSGYFIESQQMSSHAGLDVLSGPRDDAMAARLVWEPGYAGEKVVMLAPTYRPVYMQMMQVARDVFVRLGLNVDFRSMDWGSVVTRRTSREPVAQGGWSCFITQIEGWRPARRAAVSSCGAMAPKAGFAGQAMRNSNACAPPGSTRRTLRRRRQSPRRFRCVRWRHCRAFRLGICSSLRPFGRISERS
jgi:ABC-type transport system substrate-binding protein